MIQCDEDDDIFIDSGIKGSKICTSKLVPMMAIKWDPVKDATHYVVSFSSGQEKFTTQKTCFNLGEDYDLNIYPYVQAFKGLFPLTRKHAFKKSTCNLVILG